MREPLEVGATLDRALTDIAEARNYNEWLFARARPHLGRRVLDAGAGIGTFVDLARRDGAEVTALEPDPAFAERLRTRFHDDRRVIVLEGDLARLPTDESSFDSVLCLNVLEHVEDDAAAAREMLNALRPGGALLLLVPAHPRLYGGYDRAAGHVRRYTRNALRDVLLEAGFDVETLRHVNPVGAVGWLVRVRIRRGGEWPSQSFALFDRLVPALRRLDALPLPFGLSLWAVARRPP